MRITMRQIFPGVVQPMQHVCSQCKGTGEFISGRDRCSQCKGDKVVQEKKVLEVHIDKGMKHGQKIVYPGEADEAPDTVTGDVIFVLQQKQHPKFNRKLDDLYVEHSLTLAEALCGFQFVLTHLDGRRLLIKSNPGELIKPDQYKAINDEGMPNYRRPFMKGCLYIHFNVEFPDSGVISPEKCVAFKTMLPKDSSAVDLDECEEMTTYDVDIKQEMRQKEYQRRQEAYEEEDDDESSLPRMACNQQ